MSKTSPQKFEISGVSPELSTAITKEARKAFTTKSGFVRSLLVRELRSLGHDLTPAASSREGDAA